LNKSFSFNSIFYAIEDLTPITSSKFFRRESFSMFAVFIITIIEITAIKKGNIKLILWLFLLHNLKLHINPAINEKIKSSK